MPYIARNNNTNKIYYSKGANLIAKKVGIHPSTIRRHFKKSVEDKVIKGYTLSVVEVLICEKRGKSFF